MNDIIPWIATAATVTAAIMTAANLGARITGYGFAVFLIGSIAWLANGIMTGQGALTATNAVLALINLFGMWRWLGRQAKVEDGAEDAADRSRAEPGDDLFPVSLLTKAKVTGGAGEAGQCIEAMAESRSGRIRYVVISEGGVGGVGERLRRADWAALDAGTDALALSGTVTELPELPRDQWPAR